MTYIDPLPGNPWVAKATDAMAGTAAAQVYATLALAFETRTQIIQAQQRDLTEHLHHVSSTGWTAPNLARVDDLHAQVIQRTTQQPDEYPPRRENHE